VRKKIWDSDAIRRGEKGRLDVMALSICTVCGRICEKPGVNRCEAHRKDKMRPRTPNRKATMGIGAAGRNWRRARDEYLRFHQTCERCNSAPAHHVHHKDGLGPTGPNGLEPSNLLAVCRGCHAKIHDEARGRDESGRWV
jgi:5-methylcytosine-specific restriction protein A